MKNKKYGWLLVGILAGMILGRLTIPDTVWGAEPVLKLDNGQTIIEDMNHPNTQEIEEAEAYLKENHVEVPKDIEEFCIKYGKENGIAPELLEAIIWKESRFQPEAVNKSCKGLMQVNTGCHKKRMDRLGVSDIYDPEGNIAVGSDYLRELFEAHEDTATVLELYNGDGSAAADQTRDSAYAKKVMAISTALERSHWK